MTELDNTIARIQAEIAQLRSRLPEGNGSPENVLAAPLGSFYRNLEGGVGATGFLKESGGDGPTGWRAI